MRIEPIVESGGMLVYKQFDPDEVIAGLSQAMSEFLSDERKLHPEERVNGICLAELRARAQMQSEKFNSYETCQEYKAFTEKKETLQNYMDTAYLKHVVSELTSMFGDNWKSITLPLGEYFEEQLANGKTISTSDIEEVAKILESNRDIADKFDRYKASLLEG